MSAEPTIQTLEYIKAKNTNTGTSDEYMHTKSTRMPTHQNTTNKQQQTYACIEHGIRKYTCTSCTAKFDVNIRACSRQIDTQRWGGDIDYKIVKGWLWQRAKNWIDLLLNSYLKRTRMSDMTIIIVLTATLVHFILRYCASDVSRDVIRERRAWFWRQ